MICQTLPVANAVSFQASQKGWPWERRPIPSWPSLFSMAFRTKSKAACGHRPTRGNNPCHKKSHVRHAMPCPRNLRYYLKLLLDTMLQCHVQKLQRKILRRTSGNHDMPWLSLGQCLSCMCRQAREDSRPFVKEIPKRSYNGSTATWRAANALRLHAVDVSFWFIYIIIIYYIYKYIWYCIYICLGRPTPFARPSAWVCPWHARTEQTLQILQPVSARCKDKPETLRPRR